MDMIMIDVHIYIYVIYKLIIYLILWIENCMFELNCMYNMSIQH